MLTATTTAAGLAVTGASATAQSATFSKLAAVPNSYGETGGPVAVTPNGLVVVPLPTRSDSANVMDYELRFPRSTHWRLEQARLPAGAADQQRA